MKLQDRARELQRQLDEERVKLRAAAEQLQEQHAELLRQADRARQAQKERDEWKAIAHKLAGVRA